MPGESPGCRVVGSANEFSRDKIAVRTGPAGHCFRVIGLVVLSLQSMSSF